MTTEPKPKPLAWDSACLLLPDGANIRAKSCLHGSTLITVLLQKGWIKELIRKYGACRSGTEAVKGGFGLMLLNDGKAGDVIFIETRQK